MAKTQESVRSAGRKHSPLVVTYQDTRENSIDLCEACIAELERRGKWPRNSYGEEYCQESHGLHAGTCFADAFGCDPEEI